MGKQILILNGSPRVKGNTAALCRAFAHGAESAGHSVNQFDLQKLHLHPCLGCNGGGKDVQHPCVQRDDMDQLYAAFLAADVIVLASPMYYWAISAQLKMALDRFYALFELDGGGDRPQRECALLMAAADDSEENFLPVAQYYQALVANMNRTDLGMVESIHSKNILCSFSLKVNLNN